MRRSLEPGTTVVVKIGSSSLTGAGSGLDPAAVGTVVDQLAALHERGFRPVLVSSGAIAAGFPALGLDRRPTDIADLQVAAAVGQGRLMEQYAARFADHGIVVGQVLLTKDVLGNRRQYLNARAALTRMAETGVVPVVNENDTVVVDEVRVGDNDQLAAIASHLVAADMLIILTDTPGLFTDDPRLTEDARLLGAVRHNDEILDRIREGAGTGAHAADRRGNGGVGNAGVGSGGVAARMAAFSGIPTVVAPAIDADAVRKAVDGLEIGTWVEPQAESLSARKLWIAFGLPAEGILAIDDGATDALARGGRSLLGVGVTRVDGTFDRGDAVEVVDTSGVLVAKGLVRFGADDLRAALGRHSSQVGGEVIHRDDLVILTGGSG
jgi:glutamate 5-kinase